MLPRNLMVDDNKHLMGQYKPQAVPLILMQTVMMYILGSLLTTYCLLERSCTWERYYYIFADLTRQSTGMSSITILTPPYHDEDTIHDEHFRLKAIHEIYNNIPDYIHFPFGMTISTGRCGSNVKIVNSEHLFLINPWQALVKLPSGECRRASLMISQLRWGLWLCSIRHKPSHYLRQSWPWATCCY